MKIEKDKRTQFVIEEAILQVLFKKLSEHNQNDGCILTLEIKKFIDLIDITWRKYKKLPEEYWVITAEEQRHIISEYRELTHHKDLNSERCFEYDWWEKYGQAYPELREELKARILAKILLELENMKLIEIPQTKIDYREKCFGMLPYILLSNDYLKISIASFQKFRQYYAEILKNAGINSKIYFQKDKEEDKYQKNKLPEFDKANGILTEGNNKTKFYADGLLYRIFLYLCEMYPSEVNTGKIYSYLVKYYNGKITSNRGEEIFREDIYKQIFYLKDKLIKAKFALTIESSNGVYKLSRPARLF